jgi:hypothetical protein
MFNKIFIAFIISLISLCLNAQITIITEESSWSYFDQGNLGTNTWVEQNYNSSSWILGLAEFGYGDGDENTVVSYGPNASNKHITTYFRKTVSIPHLSDIKCKVKIDDGTVVYLNGLEVFRDNLPSGNISFNTPANSGFNENSWKSFTIPMSSLSNQSTLCFAIEMHQSGPSSSDLSFDFEAILQEEPPFPKIYINEIMASNENTINDNKGEASDWIELYSALPNTVNLEGYYLSDDKEDLTKHKIEGDISIQANGYQLFWASDNKSNGLNHVNFKLSSSGEWLGLIDTDGLTILDSVSFKKQKTDVSYGRPDYQGENFKFMLPPTPNADNGSSTAYEGILSPPIFSSTDPFFNTDFNLNLYSTEPGASIIFTLDGSDPNSSNINPMYYPYKNIYPKFVGGDFGQFLNKSFRSFQYSLPIEIKDRTSDPNDISLISTTISNYAPEYLPSYQNGKGTIIKARASKPGYISSPIVTHSYFKKEEGQKKYNIPYISLSFNPDKIFGFYSGIGVAGYDFDYFRTYDQTTTNVTEIGVGNYYRRGRDYEITGNFEYFDGEDITLNQNVGIRIHGNVSRHYPQKSLRLSARSEYGNSEFNYSFFKNSSLDVFKRLIIRSGGDYGSTRMRDAVLQQSVRHLNFETQNFQPIVLYLNAEYWGLMNLRERFDDDYFLTNFNIDKDSIDIIDQAKNVISGSNTDYFTLLTFVKNSNKLSSTFFPQVSQRIDIENFIDYQTTEIYYGNYDWPQNNVIMWRKAVNYNPNGQKEHDGRWRWAMYDMDNTTGTGPIFVPFFDYLEFKTRNEEYTEVLHNLLKNETFKNQFIVRNADLMNTAFQPWYVKSLINENRDKLSPYMLDQINRWKEPLLNPNDPLSLQYWLSEIEDMKDWIDDRMAFYKQHLKSKFNITGDTHLVIDVSDPNMGYVRINTIDILASTPGVSTNPYPWDGSYFENIENKLVAKPALGHKFSFWLVNGQQYLDDTLILNTTQSLVNITAYFDEDFYSENPNPLAYNISDCKYTFSHWESDRALGTYPAAMKFVYMTSTDPVINAEIEGPTNGTYNLTSRTRINGLGNYGISFINTGNADGNPGYPGTKLGGAILALNTLNHDEVYLSWKGRTINKNEREYAIKLQYRIGDILPFEDLVINNQLVNYQRQENSGDSLFFENLKLPSVLLNKPYVQLFWRYYNLEPDASGSRAELGIDDIEIKTVKHLTLLESIAVNSSFSEIISNATTPSTSLEIYNAQNSIVLMPGFETSEYSVFRAMIETCNSEN